MDVGTALWGIGRDIRELLADPFGWTVLAAVFTLPFVAGLAGLRRRMWLAALPVAIGVGVWVGWFLYYATDWWANPGIIGFWIMAGAVLFGWLVLAALMMWRQLRTSK